MTSLVALATAISLTAGCATRRAADNPPDPPATTEVLTNDGQGNEGGVGERGGPGSRADFLQAVPADRVFFELDSFSIDAEDRATLDAQAAWLARYPAVRVTIEGHADERGTREYNLALGDRRACRLTAQDRDQIGEGREDRQDRVMVGTQAMSRALHLSPIARMRYHERASE